MSSRKNLLVTLGTAVSVGLIAAAVTALLISYRCSRLSFDMLSAVCGEMAEQEPETREIISAALKRYTEGNHKGPQNTEGSPGRTQKHTGENPAGAPEYMSRRSAGMPEDILSALGYRASDFSGLSYGWGGMSAAAGLAACVVLFFFTFWYRNTKETRRIRALAGYLERVNNGKAMILSASGEDEFSRLEDEIYKTVTFLYQTRDQAVRARDDFAENLSNIAHQIRTPITAISLSVQKLRQGLDPFRAEGGDGRLYPACPCGG